MSDTTGTKLVSRPDGAESLLLRPARITITRGPDKGQKLLVDKPVVSIGSGPDCDLQLSDEAVSRRHLEIRVTDNGYQLRDLDSTNGTRIRDMLLGVATVTGQTTLEIGESHLQLSPAKRPIEIPLSSQRSFGALLGQSRAMRQVFAVLERVAPTSSTVLIQGESGTGKELAARAVHERSQRREGPFVVVDCGAIPPTLIESELFGHEKGSFTGADQTRIGALEQADNGTLFLDELGELPLELQPRLLRFLDSQQVKRIGSVELQHVDVRVVAATNRRLLGEVTEGQFRQDLYYRLSVVNLELPPLRQRPDDIILLARHFAESRHHDSREVITDQVAALLTAYSWPGNVRELRNVVERISLLPEMASALLTEQARTQAEPGIGELATLLFHDGRSRWQDIFERQYLQAQMARFGNVVVKAAKSAGLPRQTFHRLLRKHGLKE